MKIIRSIMSMCMAVILFVVFTFGINPVAYATTNATRNIRVLLMYDESYVYMMNHYAGINTNAEIETMLEEMTRLLKIPYEKTLNLNLDFTFMPYEVVLGQSYASIHGEHCLWEYSSTTGRAVKNWNAHTICGNSNCTHGDTCYVDLNSPSHASSAKRYVDRLHLYWDTVAYSDYDVCALYVGHSFCYTDSNGHRSIGGLGRVNGHAILMRGCDGLIFGSGLSIEERISDNMIRMKSCFEHEFGHNLWLFDSTATHSLNQPCCMSGGFDGIVYAENIWCDNCLERILEWSWVFRSGGIS